MLRTALTLLTLACLAPLAGAEAAVAAHAPRLALATPVEDALTLIEWLPGEVVADFYRIYGFDTTGAATLLLDTATTPAPGTLAVSVPAGYSAYGVSGVRDGAESVRIRAFLPPCILVETEPNPDVGVGCV